MPIHRNRPAVPAAWLLAAVASLATAPAQAVVPSSPLFVPEGHGAASIGGRGGRVIKVTNLSDSGPGSFRAACDATGPRIVVFEVAGVITLESALTIWNPRITIAGQTAPGDGITLRNGSSNKRPTLKIKAADVIVQYLRLRPGDAMSHSSSDTDSNIDALTMTEGSERVIADHCSLSWAIDETVQIWSGVRRVTLQNTLIAEALHWSIHPYTRDRNQPHDCAILVGVSPGEQTGEVTIHHNLLAHCSRRNPRLSCNLPVDVINNVMYNTGGDPWGIHQPAVLNDRFSDGTRFAGMYNLVDNYFKPGPDTGSAEHLIGSLKLGNPQTRVYASGNAVPSGTAEVGSDVEPFRVSQPVQFEGIASRGSAQQAYDRVLADVGACWGLNSDGSKRWRRDALDQRWVDDVINGTGGWVDTAGTIPPHDPGTVNVDSDDDGIPDDYENAFAFLDPNDPSDGSADQDGDGVTNVEEFLFGTAPGPVTTVDQTSSAPGGQPWPIPGRIEAEDYDLGGEGVAYHDTDAINEGGVYRHDGVDIEPTADGGGGYNVGWARTGEWLEYTVAVERGGAYDVAARVSSNPGGGVMQLEIDGSPVGGAQSIPATGGWDTWTDHRFRVDLPSGEHVLRVRWESGGWNLNHIEFSPVRTRTIALTLPDTRHVATIDSGAAPTVSGTTFTFSGLDPSVDHLLDILPSLTN